MARSRTRPRLRLWIGGGVLVALCAWLANWLPSLRFFRGTPADPAPTASRSTGAPASTASRSHPEPEFAAPLDPAEVDRIFGAHPELRQDLLAWRFGPAFARAQDARVEQLVREELTKAVQTLGHWIREGRILEASLRLESLTEAPAAPLRTALDEVAARLSVAATALERAASSRPAQTEESGIPPAPPWQRGSLIRYRSGAEVRSGRVEKCTPGKIAVRAQSVEGVVFPELEERFVEPAAPSVAFALHAASAALAEGRLRDAALWTACGESLPGAEREPFLALRRRLEAALK